MSIFDDVLKPAGVFRTPSRPAAQGPTPVPGFDFDVNVADIDRIRRGYQSNAQLGEDYAALQLARAAEDAQRQADRLLKLKDERGLSLDETNALERLLNIAETGQPEQDKNWFFRIVDYVDRLGSVGRLGFADVRNHLTTQRLRRAMETDVFVFHGFAELHLGGGWVKATPTFNRSLCERFGVGALEFDGVHDSLLHPFGPGSVCQLVAGNLPLAQFALQSVVFQTHVRLAQLRLRPLNGRSRLAQLALRPYLGILPQPVQNPRDQDQQNTRAQQDYPFDVLHDKEHQEQDRIIKDAQHIGPVLGRSDHGLYFDSSCTVL